ncbi:acetolactate decarboxylase [Erwinia tracheiphila]|uniref:acetolactate decarboxylase n=1 Tax=Erwinia tracheiphila TaxID=65700 RepID=UPI00398B08DA
MKGKLVGFWTSELYGHISVHGFHFIDEKQQISGHVLFYHAEEAIVSYEESRP